MDRYSKDSNKRRATVWPQVLTALPLIILIGFIAYLGWHSRYLADDFCTAGWMRQLGFFESQAYWRDNWSGRFSYFFLANTLHLIGPATTKLVPAFILAMWGLASFALAREILELFGYRVNNLNLLTLASLLPATTLGSTPNLYQSILWQTGALTYSLPLALMTGLASWIIHRWKQDKEGGESWTLLALTLFFTLLIGGFSETMAAVQLALSASALITLTILGRGFSKKRRLFQHLLVTLVGATAAMMIVVTAPGNNVRQGLMEAPAPIIQVLIESVRNTYLFSAQVYNYKLGWVILSFLVPFIIFTFGKLTAGRTDSASWQQRLSHNWRALLAIPALTVLLVVATMFPSQYALGSYPDGRVLVMAHYWVVAGVTLWGGLLGSLFKPVLNSLNLPVASGIGWLLIFSLGVYLTGSFVSSNTSLLADAREYAQSWDERDQQLQMAQPDQDEPIAAASLSHIGGSDELERDPDYWVNRCVAMTYGLGKVIAK